MIGHWLNRTLQVWRPQTTSDGAGGQAVTYEQQPEDVRAKVDQPSPGERMLAAQAGSAHSHTVYLSPSADVRRGDQLRDAATGEVWRVLAVVGPSTARYRKAETELIQEEGQPNG